VVFCERCLMLASATLREGTPLQRVYLSLCWLLGLDGDQCGFPLGIPGRWFVVGKTVGRRVVVAAVVSAVLLLGASPVIAAIATWSAPVDVSATLQDAGNPQVTVDSTGRAVAVWYGYDGANNRIQSSTSVNGGAWSTLVNLSATGRDAGTPQVTVDSTGRAVAVWYRYDGANNIIQSSTSVNGGAWSTPVDLSDSLQNSGNPQVTVDSTGRAVAVWWGYDGANNRIQSSTSVNGGAWSTPVDLSATLQKARDPQVTVDSTGRAIAVWYRSNGANNIIQSSSEYGPPAPVSGGAALAATGVNAMLPLGVATLLLLAGTAIVVLRRRAKTP
jgi:hypothetical protein